MSSRISSLHQGSRHECVETATIEGDVGSLQQCCLQQFEVLGKDDAPSRVRAPRGFAHSTRVEGVDGMGRMIGQTPE